MNAKLTTLDQLLGAPLELGQALSHGALRVFPLLGEDAADEFISLDQALPLGFRLEELPEGDVNNLLAINPTPKAVLLLDGQAVLGARQNRIFDGSFVVAPGTEAMVGVCCIERGRWESGRQREAFRSAAHFADPRVRTAQRVTRAAEPDGTQRSHQGAVWESIDGLIASSKTVTCTASLADVQVSHAELAEEMTAHIEVTARQLGVLVYLGDELIGVELVGRADVYREVHEPLLRGFSLVAAERAAERGAADRARAEADLTSLLRQPVSLEASSDGAERVRGEGASHGQGLARCGTLVHWSTIAA
jgi:hypothetical protein